VKKTFYKLISLISLSILLFVLNSPFAFALEVSYPDIPGLTKPVENDLPSYIAYLFGFGTYIAGIIAIISFAIGAVQLVMSASNPSLSKDAKDRMLSSIFGLILTLSAFVILQTINSKFVTPTLTVLPGGEGIFYTNGSDYKPAPQSEADTENIPEGYKKLIYRCSDGPILLIWKFPKINFEGNDKNYEGVTVVRKKCGEEESLSETKSFKISYESPGIYYCLSECNEDMCSGYMSGAVLSSGILSDPFKNNLKSIRIVNNLSSDINYGIIFHSKDDSTSAGDCTQPLFSKDSKKEIECFNNVLVSTSSTIFFWNNKAPETSGQGAVFYSEPFGWAKGAESAGYFLGPKTIANYWTGEAQNMTLDYFGVERPDGYEKLYQNFQQRSGSIRVKGNYMVVLWTGSSCQVFFKDVVNLKSTEITAMGGNIDKINVVPIK